MLPARKDQHGALLATGKTHPTDLNLINKSFLVSSFELHVGPLTLHIILTEDDDCLPAVLHTAEYL